MIINQQLISTAVQTAKTIFSQQTADDLRVIQEHAGRAYSEANLIAEVAVKLVLRLSHLQTLTDSRQLSPVDVLVREAEKLYQARYGG